MKIPLFGDDALDGDAKQQIGVNEISKNVELHTTTTLPAGLGNGRILEPARLVLPNRVGLF